MSTHFPPVSKVVKSAPTAENASSFEESLKKLESIVEAMESDDLPLDQLIQRFEEAR